MAEILITTISDDIHSAAVALRLRELGHDVYIFHGSDFPQRATATIRLADGRCGTHVRTANQYRDLRGFDIVWNRRHRRYQLPDHLHPADKSFAHREIGEFASSIWGLAGEDAFWVNHRTASAEARKPLQLVAAQEIGLQIPDSLITNSPCEIRNFVERCEQDVIYKGFFPAVWETAEGNAVLYTSELSLGDLPSDEVLRSVPGIYQVRVPKAYEVRATFMGATCFAARIDSQSSVLGSLDWRCGQTRFPPNLDPEVLPTEIYERCRRLMDRFGIVFACFDFIVTPDGEFVFLEFNEAGQFLFVELQIPEYRMLDAFVQFLLSRNPSFQYREPSEAVSVSSYLDGGNLDAFLGAENDAHITATQAHRVREN